MNNFIDRRKNIQLGLKQLLVGRFKVVDRFEKYQGETPCEVVSEDEVYLLIETEDAAKAIYSAKSIFFKRGRRICGQLRRTEGRLLRCRQIAGKGTNHLGYGKCKFHERFGGKARLKSLRILTGYKARGFALSLKEFLSLSEIDLINDPKIGKIDEEILIAEHLLRTLLVNDWIKPKQIIEVLSLLKELKVARSRIETDALVMDRNSLKLFVDSFFDAIYRTVRPDVYSRIVSVLENEILVPWVINDKIKAPSRDVGKIEIQPFKRLINNSSKSI